MNRFAFLSLASGGVIAFVVALICFVVRAALEGRSGVTFADLATAEAIAGGVAIVPLLTTWIAMRRMRGRGFDADTASHVAFTSSGRSSGSDRFDRFTDGARKVLTFAQDEAVRFNHAYVGTEHILLGLIRERDGVAARALENMNVELAKVRTAVEFIIGRGGSPAAGEVGLTPGAKRVIELAIDEARRLGHHYIGTEHLLLGLVREGEGIAAGVLESVGVNIENVRHQVIRTAPGQQGREEP